MKGGLSLRVIGNSGTCQVAELVVVLMYLFDFSNPALWPKLNVQGGSQAGNLTGCESPEPQGVSGERFKVHMRQPGRPGICLFPAALLFCLETVSSSWVLGGCPGVPQGNQIFLTGRVSGELSR